MTRLHTPATVEASPEASRAQLRLEVGDAPAHRGQRHADLPRRRREPTGLGNGHEGRH